jgi:two-component system cell cycle sensor histidine kinase/response regulator CckA
VYGIVKQSGGHVAVESEPRRGTTFKIYLPRDPQGAGTIQSTVTPRTCLNGTETVLLVEDEEGVRSLARTVLTQQGYRVLEASNGIDALRICEEYKDTIHLVATDDVMPQMSGRDLVERLQVQRTNIKVLYMSGYTDDAIMRHGVLNAEVPFLQKPYTPDMIAQTVRAALDGPKHNGITKHRTDHKDKSSPRFLGGDARLRL